MARAAPHLLRELSRVVHFALRKYNRWTFLRALADLICN